MLFQYIHCDHPRKIRRFPPPKNCYLTRSWCHVSRRSEIRQNDRPLRGVIAHFWSPTYVFKPYDYKGTSLDGTGGRRRGEKKPKVGPSWFFFFIEIETLMIYWHGRPGVKGEAPDRVRAVLRKVWVCESERTFTNESISGLYVTPCTFSKLPASL